MQRLRLFSLLFFASVFLLTLGGLSAQTISLAVDATGTQQKLLRVHEVIPVSEETALLPEMDSGRAWAQWADREPDRDEVCWSGQDDSVGARYA